MLQRHRGRNCDMSGLSFSILCIYGITVASWLGWVGKRAGILFVSLLNKKKHVNQFKKRVSQWSQNWSLLE